MPSPGSPAAARIVAHRGNAAEFPENTLPAIASAIELGAGGVEFDVQLSADGIPVLAHDRDLQRTGGLPIAVLDSDAARLTACSVHEPQRLGARHAGTALPLLADAVALLAASPRILPFIEIKRASIGRHGLARVLDAVLGAAAPLKTRAVIISFACDAVAGAMARGWRGGLVLAAYDEPHRAQLAALQPEFVFCNHEKLPPDETQLWPGAWQWVMYEVTDAATARALFARGAALIETMQVAALLAGLQAA